MFDERDVHTAVAHHASCHSGGGWEESWGVDVGSSVIKGSRMKFLRRLIEDVQTRFKRAEWDGSANLEDWVEASSRSCERVFSYVTATDFGQTTERMFETLWVRCNGEAPEDWGPFEVFEDLRKTPFPSALTEARACC